MVGLRERPATELTPSAVCLHDAEFAEIFGVVGEMMWDGGRWLERREMLNIWVRELGLLSGWCRELSRNRNALKLGIFI